MVTTIQVEDADAFALREAVIAKHGRTYGHMSKEIKEMVNNHVKLLKGE